jgi:hypothetical protein
MAAVRHLRYHYTVLLNRVSLTAPERRTASKKISNCNPFRFHRFQSAVFLTPTDRRNENAIHVLLENQFPSDSWTEVYRQEREKSMVQAITAGKQVRINSWRPFRAVTPSEQVPVDCQKPFGSVAASKKVRINGRSLLISHRPGQVKRARCLGHQPMPEPAWQKQRPISP